MRLPARQGTIARRSASARTSSISTCSRPARARRVGSVTPARARLWLTTQAKGAMPGPPEVGGEARGLVDRRRLGQGHDQHPGVTRDRAGAAGARRHRSRHLGPRCARPRGGRPRPRRAAAGCGRSARCRAPRSRARPRRRCARRRGRPRSPRCRASAGPPRAGRDPAASSPAPASRSTSCAVARRSRPRVDAADREPLDRRGDGRGDVGRRVGRGEMHRWPAARQLAATAAAIVVLPTPPFPIVMMTPRTAGFEASTSVGERCAGDRPAPASSAVAGADDRPAVEHGAEGGGAERPNGWSGSSTRASTASDPRASARVPRACWPARVAAVGSSSSAGANTPLSTSTWWRMPSAGELARGARRLGERARLGPRHQDEGGARRVGQRGDALRVERPLALEPGERPQARGAAGVLVEEPGPGRRQRQQAQRVPGGRGVEDDVVEARAVAAASPRRRVNSSNAAISTVHAPDSCSSMLRSAASGSTPR